MKNTTWLPALLLLFALGSIGVTACDNQGPAEEAGENIDEAAEDTAQAWDDTTDDIKDRYEEETADEK